MRKKFLGLGRSLLSTGIDFNKFTSTKDMSASLEALLSSPGLKGPDRLALEPRILLDAAGVDTAETAINEVAQADAEGGMVPTVQKADGTFELQGAWFRVEMQLETHDGQNIVPTAMNRGVAVLNGEPQSLLVSGLRQIASVLIRESGF